MKTKFWILHRHTINGKVYHGKGDDALIVTNDRIIIIRDRKSKAESNDKAEGDKILQPIMKKLNPICLIRKKNQ